MIGEKQVKHILRQITAGSPWIGNQFLFIKGLGDVIHL